MKRFLSSKFMEHMTLLLALAIVSAIIVALDFIFNR